VIGIEIKVEIELKIEVQIKCGSCSMIESGKESEIVITIVG